MDATNTLAIAVNGTAEAQDCRCPMPPPLAAALLLRNRGGLPAFSVSLFSAIST